MEAASSSTPPETVLPESRPLIVGWREYLALPDWGIRRMKVKMDTGARTSALDVARYELHTVNGSLVAELHIAVSGRRPDRVHVVQTPALGTVVVCDTGGRREERPLVETTIRLGPVTKRIRLTITSRRGLRFRMILGRKALENDFMVDVSKHYLLGRKGKG
jgi:hypothetical protein